MTYKTYEVRVYDDGTKEWLYNGNLHREDGPAIEYSDGGKRWYQNGKRHRTDGPAAEYPSGSKYWYQNGKFHREDGPAIDHVDGSKEWYLNGDKYSEEEFWNKINPPEPKELTVADLEKLLGYPVKIVKE